MTERSTGLAWRRPGGLGGRKAARVDKIMGISDAHLSSFPAPSAMSSRRWSPKLLATASGAMPARRILGTMCACRGAARLRRHNPLGSQGLRRQLLDASRGLWIEPSRLSLSWRQRGVTTTRHVGFSHRRMRRRAPPERRPLVQLGVKELGPCGRGLDRGHLHASLCSNRFLCGRRRRRCIVMSDTGADSPLGPPPLVRFLIATVANIGDNTEAKS